MTTQQGSLDGRTARRHRNRESVIDAVLDAIEAGESVPTIKQVAELAGVSERSVFRYFGDLDELLTEAVQRGADRYRPHSMIPDEGQGSLDERIDTLIEARLSLWVRADAASGLVRSRSQRLPVLRDGLRETRERLMAQVERHLGDYLARLPPEDADDALHMTDLVVSYESFRLQLDGGATANEVRGRWRYALRALLAAAR